MGNPKFYEGMLSTGYEGVREIQKRLRDTMVWSATAGEVDNFVFEDANGVFIEDAEMQQRLLDTNPNAFRDMVTDSQRFFDQSSRIIERALSEHVDLFVDYSGASETDNNVEDRSGYKIHLTRCFYDERWSRNRCVTCMDWSPQFPELLVASYHNNEDSPHDPDGVCLVWNTRFKKSTPEYIFHCQSP